MHVILVNNGLFIVCSKVNRAMSMEFVLLFLLLTLSRSFTSWVCIVGLILIVCLIYCKSKFHFYTSGFLTFSGGIEMEHCFEICYKINWNVTKRITSLFKVGSARIEVIYIDFIWCYSSVFLVNFYHVLLLNSLFYGWSWNCNYVCGSRTVVLGTETY